MKRVCTILTTLLLSLTIVLANGGLAVVHCAHSGTSRLALVLSLYDDQPQGCGTSGSCMSTDVVQLSPTDVAQQTVYDFHVFQPLLTPMLPATVATPVLPVGARASARSFIPPMGGGGGSPRLYLSKLCTLII